MTRTITVLFILLTEIVNTMGFCVVSFRLQKGLSLYNAGNDYSTWEGAFPDAEVVHVSLPKHRPLGCTVEESLADSDLKPVFVSKIVEGGFASKAGMKVGDVIVAISGIFGGMNNVLGKGIEEVTSTVAGIADEAVLEFRIVRGTQVLAQHESALVDLCASVGEDEQAIEDCVVSFLNSAYSDEIDDQTETEGPCSDDEETECLLDDMFENLWGSETAETVAPAAKADIGQRLMDEAKPKSSKPLPWRSRSSPSGTFVRDPKTGKMRNIDA